LNVGAASTNQNKTRNAGAKRITRCKGGKAIAAKAPKKISTKDCDLLEILNSWR
jgi:hypothetical protein